MLIVCEGFMFFSFFCERQIIFLRFSVHNVVFEKKNNESKFTFVNDEIKGRKICDILYWDLGQISKNLLVLPEQRIKREFKTLITTEAKIFSNGMAIFVVRTPSLLGFIKDF